MRRSDGQTVGRTVRAVGIAVFLTVCPSVRPSVAQCPDGTPPPCGRPARALPIPAFSVAILTFDNRSRDTSDAFLADGLPDEIATRLSQVGRLVVRSRPQVRRLHGVETMTIPDIGRALNVAYLVTGSVQRSGTRLRVNVELLRASTAQQVWGNPYDRDRNDLLDVQSQIAGAVAGTIAGHLLPQERQAVGARPTLDREAYEHYLRANQAFLRRMTTSAAWAAVREYQRATELDTAFAAAWAGLARAQMWIEQYGLDPLVPHDVPARGALARARQLAPGSSATLLAAGDLAPLSLEGRDEARHDLVAALRRDSMNAEILVLLASVEVQLGHADTAVALAERAAAIDPRDPAPANLLSRLYAAARRFDEAGRYIDRLIALDPSDPEPRFQRALIAVCRSGDLAAMRADDARGLQALGEKSLLDISNGVIYPLMRLDTAVMAFVDRLEVARGAPVYPEYYWMKAVRASEAGRGPEARAYFDSLLAKLEEITRARGRIRVLLWKADAYAGLGRDSEAVATIEIEVRHPSWGAASLYEAARLLATIGRPEPALDVLERLLREPSVVTPQLIALDPGFSSLRGNPRFARLISAN